MAKKFVVWFKDVDHDDIGIVGGKGANLGEMTKAGFPVPNGFIVTAQAYYHFLDESGLRDEIHDALDGLDVSNSNALDKAAVTVQKHIIGAKFPKDIAEPVLKAYFTMDKGLKHALVAVRSSATAEDLPGASFAGQQSTFLNVYGETNVIEKVKEAWASLFTARAIFYRQTNKFDHFKVGIAIPVQKMVDSDKSGIMFTIDPVTNDKHKIMIEAIYGLGEMIVQGAVTPDHYEVDKKSWKITDIKLGTQEKMMIKKGTDNAIIALHSEKGRKQKLTEEEILAVALQGKKLEKHYYFPQDIEWAIEDGIVYIVQTRPVTTVGKDMNKPQEKMNAKREVIVQGDPASPGIATGPVKYLASPKQINKILAGDVLVAQQTNPDFVPAMKKAVAIVTERGGRTSHAAIVSRELGIPAVVGATDAVSKLKDNMIVTVNGATGEVYRGAVLIGSSTPAQTLPVEKIKTATHVYVNLAEPSRAEAVAKMNADGVGLLRAEFMIADIGVHPKKLIADHKEKLFIHTLAEKLEIFAKAFNPRPVVYRATDFKTNEYRNLKGGAQYEPEEPNPMLGFRGAARYVADSRVFEMEIDAIKMVRNKMGYKNLHLMLPFVRNPKELMDVKKLVSQFGLTRSSNFKLWLMVEIPTNVIRLEDFLDVGVDGVSIGSNDLTMLMLGTDRDNSEVAHDFSELDPTLLWSFERVARICGKRGVTTSMCGQAPSDYPDLVEKLVSWGFTSMSVNPDAIDHVRATVHEAEKEIDCIQTQKDDVIPMMSTKIYSCFAREIIDSRGNPTIETTVLLESGYRGVASAPAGASKGKYEAVELRDGDKTRYMGLGVLKAVANVNTLIHSKLRGLDALDQEAIDRAMLELDGTPNKSNLGANSILSVSLAAAVAAANHQRQPLYMYLNTMFSRKFPTKIERMPTPTFNMINGGLHGAGNLDFQEFHVVPATNKPFHLALQAGVEIYNAAKQILSYRNAVHSVGDEGGFAPNLFTNIDAFEVLMEAIRNTKYKFGLEVFFGLDLASSTFLTDSGYRIKDRPVAFRPDEFIDYLAQLHKKYRMLILEDALEEDDWDGWKRLTKKMGQDMLIVGDDFLATNPVRLERAINEKSCSALLAKPNQIGSLTEFFEVIAIAKKNDIKVITSHRSGETTDTFVSDLAVAIQSEYVKFGAPARGERVVKYNRLLAIESELFPFKMA